jgi:hypothetical protein
MSDERFPPRSYEQQDDPSPSTQNGHHGPAVPLALMLRPYRVIQRYRGDRLDLDATLLEWSDLWRLRAGDVSWPDERRG